MAQFAASGFNPTVQPIYYQDSAAEQQGNALALAGKAIANTGAQQSLDNAQTVRDNAQAIANGDRGALATASGADPTATGGLLANLQAGTANQMAQSAAVLQNHAQIASAVLGAPAEQRAALWAQLAPTAMKGANGIQDFSPTYPGDDAVTAALRMAVPIATQLEYRSKTPSDMPSMLGTAAGGGYVGAGAGAAPLDAMTNAIYSQESGGGANTATSVAGARGGMQIQPGTFAQYARPGERIDNPTDNMAVGKRIVADLAQKFGNDPARVAVGYFSGEGNVAPLNSPTPWKVDKADPTGKTTSSYVQDVVGRVGRVSGGSSAPAAAPAPAPLPPSGVAPRAPVQVASAANTNGTPPVASDVSGAGPAAPPSDFASVMARLRGQPPANPLPAALMGSPSPAIVSAPPSPGDMPRAATLAEWAQGGKLPPAASPPSAPLASPPAAAQLSAISSPPAGMRYVTPAEGGGGMEVTSMSPPDYAAWKAAGAPTRPDGVPIPLTAPATASAPPPPAPPAQNPMQALAPPPAASGAPTAPAQNPLQAVAPGPVDHHAPPGWKPVTDGMGVPMKVDGQPGYQMFSDGQGHRQAFLGAGLPGVPGRPVSMKTATGGFRVINPTGETIAESGPDLRAPQQAQLTEDYKDIKPLSQESLGLEQSLQKTLEARNAAANLPTGAGFDARQKMASYLQTYFPGMAAKFIGPDGAMLPDVAKSEEAKKLLSGQSLLQEKQNGGSGGLGLSQIYLDSNPNLNMQPQSIRDMSNLAAVSTLAAKDYAQGKINHITQNSATFTGGGQTYTPAAAFDRDWFSKNNVNTYMGAINAMNGKPYAVWSNGLSSSDKARALGVVARIDPTSTVVGRDGHPLPVRQFSPTNTANPSGAGTGAANQ